MEGLSRIHWNIQKLPKMDVPRMRDSGVYGGSHSLTGWGVRCQMQRGTQSVGYMVQVCRVQGVGVHCTLCRVQGVSDDSPI